MDHGAPMLQINRSWPATARCSCRCSIRPTSIGPPPPGLSGGAADRCRNPLVAAFTLGTRSTHCRRPSGGWPADIAERVERGCPSPGGRPGTGFAVGPASKRYKVKKALSVSRSPNTSFTHLAKSADPQGLKPRSRAWTSSGHSVPTASGHRRGSGARQEPRTSRARVQDLSKAP